MADVWDTGLGNNSPEFEKIKEEIEAIEHKANGAQSSSAEKEALAALISDIGSLKAYVSALEKMRKADMIEASRDIEVVALENQSLRKALISLKNRLDALESDVKTYATFIRFVGTEKQGEDKDARDVQVVEIRSVNGTRSRVFFVVEGVDPKTLKYGQQLLVFGGSGMNHVVGVLDQFSIDGRQAVVNEILGEDREGARFLVSSRDDISERLIVRPASHIAAAAIKEGARVLVDYDAHLIIEVLPPQEGGEYVVDEIPDVTFDDIGGLKDIVTEIARKISWPIAHADVYERFNLPSPRGFCLSGPPGVGKTMLGKAIAHHLAEMIGEKSGEKVVGHFMSIAGPELQNKYVGETERKMRNVFKRAKAIATPQSPVVIFFDEAESLFATRGSGISSDTEKTNVTQFTALMDGLNERGNIVVILATNRIDLIDSAVIRSGRCDKVFTVLRPDRTAAGDIFRKYLLPEHVHPKYLQSSLYVPRDRSGRPRRGGPKAKKIELRFSKNPARVVDYLVDEAVERMYNEHIEKNRFMALKFEGEKEWKYLRYGDFSSGALIANIVERAKFYAVERIVTGEEEDSGIEKKDLMRAIEEVFSELRAPQTIGFHEWLSIQGFSEGRRVERCRLLKSHDTIAEEKDGD